MSDTDIDWLNTCTSSEEVARALTRGSLPGGRFVVFRGSKPLLVGTAGERGVVPQRDLFLSTTEIALSRLRLGFRYEYFQTRPMRIRLLPSNIGSDPLQTPGPIPVANH